MPNVASDEEFQRLTLPALDLVHNLARRFTRDRADAEDLVQETYLRAWAAWNSGRRPERVEPWLATICLNAGRDRARRAATRLETTTAMTAPDDVPDGVDVAEEAIDRVQRALIERALWALPAEQRVAIALMDLGGFTAAEVAKMTGSPRGTVLARVHRGRKTLARDHGRLPVVPARAPPRRPAARGTLATRGAAAGGPPELGDRRLARAAQISPAQVAPAHPVARWPMALRSCSAS